MYNELRIAIRLWLPILCGSVLVAAIVQGEDRPIRDPMRPYSPPVTAGTDGSVSRDVSLTAVLISSERRIAVIDGAFYRVGDEVAGARIARIEARSIHLARGNEIQIVPLNPSAAGVPTEDGESSR